MPEIKYALITTLSPLCWTLYTVLGKKLVHERSPLVVTYLSIVLGTIPVLPFVSGHFLHTLAHMGATHWLALFHLSVMSTLIGFWIWIAALRRLPATSVASFIYLNPPFAAAFGWLLFGEEVTGLFLLGSTVVLFGLYLSQSRR
jgi:drug/metabolite transporter (DMT)-like permease